MRILTKKIRNSAYSFLFFALCIYICILFITTKVAISEIETEADWENVAYDPPLRSLYENVEAINGLVPGIDIHRTPDGSKYVTGIEIYSSENGEDIIRKGVFTIPTEPIDYNNYSAEKPISNILPPPRSVISQSLAEKLQTLRPEFSIRIVVRLHYHPNWTIPMLISKAEALGLISTYSERTAYRQELLQRRASEISAIREPLIGQITNLNGLVISTFNYLSKIIVEVKVEHVVELSTYPNVSSIGIESNNIFRPTTYDTDDVYNLKVEDVTQSDQLISASYDGEGPTSSSSDDIVIGAIDIEFLDEHVVFLDCSSCGDRIRSRWNCYDGGCISTTDLPTPPTGVGYKHGTLMAAIAAADLRDGQDPNKTDPTDRADHSGHAGEARLILFRIAEGNTIDDIFDKALELGPDILAMSIHTGGDDDCVGNNDEEEDINDVFESGIFYTSSAGNDGHSDPDDCTVTSPAPAEGAFAVGAFGGDYTDVTIEQMEEQDIPSYTARGGGPITTNTGYHADARTIVDIAGWSGRLGIAKHDDPDGYNDNSGVTGTSPANFEVAGAAANWLDFWVNEASTTMSPGRLTANLLLFGDRTYNVVSGNSLKLISGFDELWGAGRLKMRMYNDEGLDAPWAWGTGEVCIDNGENHIISIGSGPLSLDVDQFRAVIWWYDRTIEEGGTSADVDLFLQNSTGTITYRSDASYDTKSRVYYGSPGGKSLRLKISGYSVPVDTPECGTDSIRVYYAWLYEDLDRDDSNGPPSDIE